jgi:pimeloyl-ACP methyl ester carboxylesterase
MGPGRFTVRRGDVVLSGLRGGERGDLVLLLHGLAGAASDPARLGAWFRSWPVPFADEAAAVAFLGATPTAEAWARDLEVRADGRWPRFDADVVEAAIRAVADTARWDEWQSVTAPTLLVRGDRGNTDEGELRRMLDLRPDVEQAVISDAGHDAHLDQPAAWQRILRGFLGDTV